MQVFISLPDVKLIESKRLNLHTSITKWLEFMQLNWVFALRNVQLSWQPSKRKQSPKPSWITAIQACASYEVVQSWDLSEMQTVWGLEFVGVKQRKIKREGEREKES